MSTESDSTALRNGVFHGTRGDIRYSIGGHGHPLCLVTTLSGTWSSQARNLQQQFTVLTYDMCGFGQSTSLNGFPDNAAHADDLADLLNHLKIYDAVVVGLSHGGIVSQVFAARYPHLLRGLVLVSTLGTASGGTKLLLEMLDRFLVAGKKEEFWEVLKSFLVSERNYEKIMRHEARVRQAMFDAYTAAGLHSIYHGALTHDGASILRRIHAPTLVIGGSEDMLFPPRITTQIADSISGASLHFLAAAHVPPVEVPEDFRQALIPFAQQCFEVNRRATDSMAAAP